MTILVDETLRAVYYLSGHEQDYLCGVNECADGSILMQYRFRYYDGEQHKGAFDNDDTKTWHLMRYKSSSDGVLEAVLEACQHVHDTLLAAGYVPPGGIACTLVRGDMSVEQFLDEFKKLPFVHTRN